MSTPWRTAAFGEAISYDPASDIRLGSGDIGEWIVSDTGDHAFVVLPFQDQTLYTDLGDPSIQYVGLLLLTANNDHSGNFTTMPVGSWLPVEITARFGDGNGGIRTEYRRDWLSAAGSYPNYGLTVEPDGVGVVFPISKAPFIVRDLTAVPDPPPPAPVDPVPVDPAPADPAPLEPALADPAPLEPALADPAPLEPALAEPAAPTVPLTWRTFALGDEISFDPVLDLGLTLDPTTNTYHPGGTAFAFAELPLVAGDQYTDLAFDGDWGYVGMLEVLANDGSAYPYIAVGDLFLASLASPPSSSLDFTTWDTAVDGLAPAGLTLVQRALGVLWPPASASAPFVVEDLTAPTTPPTPATLAPVPRFRTRHLHRTLVDYARAILTGGDWFDDPPTIFAPINSYPVNLIDYEPQMMGETPEFNTVAVSMGDEGEDAQFELGNFSATVRIPVFFDIYPLNEPIGIAIADDLKAGLVDRQFPLRDYTASPAVDTVGLIELEHVMIERLQSTVMDKRSWRCVKATAVLYTNGF